MPKEHKISLLQGKKASKYAPVNEQWIQMQDLKESKQKENNHYVRLEQELYPSLDQPSVSQLQQYKAQKPKFQDAIPTISKQHIYNSAVQRAAMQEEVQVPTTASTVYKPNIIKMNGSIFKREPERKKPSLPPMQVACDTCTVMQNVPGNAQVYICGTCDAMNECYPLYGVFICGCCNKQVAYAYGTSQFIKCTNCTTINKVATEPMKKYARRTQNQEKMHKQQAPGRIDKQYIQKRHYYEG